MFIVEDYFDDDIDFFLFFFFRFIFLNIGICGVFFEEIIFDDEGDMDFSKFVEQGCGIFGENFKVLVFLVLSFSVSDKGKFVVRDGD